MDINCDESSEASEPRSPGLAERERLDPDRQVLGHGRVDLALRHVVAMSCAHVFGKWCSECAALMPMFLRVLSDLELVKLQHELRSVPEDKVSLNAVLIELGRRERLKVGK